jgi:hypothetical protein
MYNQLAQSSLSRSNPPEVNVIIILIQLTFFHLPQTDPNEQIFCFHRGAYFLSRRRKGARATFSRMAHLLALSFKSSRSLLFARERFSEFLLINFFLPRKFSCKHRRCSPRDNFSFSDFPRSPARCTILNYVGRKLCATPT